jgi:penicillin amidase/acyl-homoserine-lactone acylase
MFNVTYADDRGNIYYLYNGLLPVRPEGYDWSLYLPGNTSETLWTGYLPFDQLPQVLNPTSGFVQNCNSTPFRTTIGPENPEPTDFSPSLGIETTMTNRALRALELLRTDPSITEQEFYNYKFDTTYSSEGDMPEYIRRILDAPLPHDPEVQAALDLVRDWDMEADAQDSTMALMIWTLQLLDFPEPEELNPVDLADAFSTAVHTLQENHGRVDVPWPLVNRLRHGTVDVGLAGGPDLLHAVYGTMSEDARLIGHQGDSLVMLVTWDKHGQVHSRSIHQYGSATQNEMSPHYADQAPLFADRRLKSVWLDESDIRAHLEREYRPGEELGP